MPVPQGGIGRVLIYKTYKDPRTYMMHGEDIVWVRSLSGYRLGVMLPKGLRVSLVERRRAADDDRRRPAEAGVREPERPEQSGHDSRAQDDRGRSRRRDDNDMFFDDVKTLYDLEAPESGRVTVEQIYSDYRKGARARLDSLAYLPLQDLKVIDLDTAQGLLDARKTARRRSSSSTCRSSTTGRARTSRSPARSRDPSYKRDRRRARLRSRAERPAQHDLLPAGWEVSARLAVRDDRHLRRAARSSR